MKVTSGCNGCTFRKIFLASCLYKNTQALKICGVVCNIVVVVLWII